MNTPYTLIAGTQEWSSWSLRPYLALRATGAPFTLEVIRLRVDESPTTRETILRHSPAGKVPVLQYGAVTIWDSLAICETLAERHPGAGLWPDDAAARALARAFACEMHSGFPDLREQLPMAFSRQRPLPELRPETSRQIGRVIAAWDGALAAHEQSAGGFLFGRFSVADCMYAPVVSRFTSYGVAVPPRVQAYMERIWALPAMQDWRAAARAEVAAGLPA